MTDRPYTDGDLRAEAARQHLYLSRVDADDPEGIVTCISDRMTSASIPSTVTDLEPETGEAYEMSRAWGHLPAADFQQARHAVGELLGSAANVSEWAVNLGADGLEPDAHVITIGAADKPIARLHFAFEPGMSESMRNALVEGLGQSLADAL